MPTRPPLSRKATRSSPRILTRVGGQSRVGGSEASRVGSQYWRNSARIGVPGPTWVKRSLSSFVSIPPSRPFFLGGFALDPPAELRQRRQRRLLFLFAAHRRQDGVAPTVVAGKDAGDGAGAAVSSALCAKRVVAFLHG